MCIRDRVSLSNSICHVPAPVRILFRPRPGPLNTSYRLTGNHFALLPAGLLRRLCRRLNYGNHVLSAQERLGKLSVPSIGISAVSYTHLDVYKRQG